jgi:peptide/nickel transport system substrate-binding protein
MKTTFGFGRSAASRVPAPFPVAPALSLLLLVLLFPLCGCGKGGAKAPAADGGTFVMGRGGDSPGLDPAHETDGESHKVCDNIFDTLVQYTDSTTEIMPDLAYRWEHSADALTWTFHLRPGVKFHDGTPCDAAAVVFSLAREDSAFGNPFNKVGGPYTYWQSMGMGSIIKGLKAADDSTVVITLYHQNAPFLANLAMNFCSIVSPTALKKWGPDFFKHPVGTGPFKFVEWVKDDHITLARNDDYFGGKPYLATLIFRSIPDNTVRFLELQKGNLQGMDGIAPDQVDPIQKNASLTLLTQPGMNVCYIALNETVKPFDNPKVRQALNLAVNKKAIVETLYRNLAMAAVNPMPPVVWGYDKNVQPYPYDPAKARELLKEAGFPNGFKTQLWAMSVPRPYVPEPQKVAEAIQADFKAIGVEAEIVSSEWKTYLDKTQNGEHTMCIMGWTGDNGDPDNFLYTLMDKTAARKPSQNLAFYMSEKFHRLVSDAQNEPEQGKRTALYEQAQQLVHDDAVWVPLVHTSALFAQQKNVSGYRLHPTGKERFYRTRLN